MEESPTPKFNPELVFRRIVFRGPGNKFSKEDIASDWREKTGEEPPDYLFTSLETLVLNGRLFKTEDGLYQESPF